MADSAFMIRSAVLVLAVLGCPVGSSAGCSEGSRQPAAGAPAAQSGPTPGAPAAPAPSTRQAFEGIYAKAVWGKNTEGQGHSGTGSTLRSTAVYRAFLQQFLADNQIRSVVDAGCGDWEFSQTIDWTGIDYKGYDIVEAVVARNKAGFAAPNVQFFTANIVEQELPPADLLISKHVLQHLPNADVQKFLPQLHKYKHVLLVNGVDLATLSAANADIVPGGYRELDVTRAPFNLPGAKVLTYWDGHHMHQVVHIAGTSR
jgi:SAM-dependent methyltransferase